MSLQVKREKIQTSQSSIDQPYWVGDDAIPQVDVDRNNALAAALAQAKADFGSTPVLYTLQRLSPNSYRVVAQYRDASSTRPTIQQIDGEPWYSFNYSAAPETFFFTKYSTLVYPASAPTWGGLVGIKGDLPSHGAEHRGITITPRITDTVQVTIHATTEWTLNYRKKVRALMGKVNNETFLGEPEGSYRFVMCRSVLRTDTELQLIMGFDFRENPDAYTINGISVAAHEGHQQVWTYNDLFIDSGTVGEPFVFSQVKYVYVETLLEKDNLGSLFHA